MATGQQAGVEVQDHSAEASARALQFTVFLWIILTLLLIGFALRSRWKKKATK